MPPENNQNFNNPIPQEPDKKSSSLNTVLLILLIALVGFGIWILKSKNIDENILRSDDTEMKYIKSVMYECDYLAGNNSDNLVVKERFATKFFEEKVVVTFKDNSSVMIPRVIFADNGVRFLGVVYEDIVNNILFAEEDGRVELRVGTSARYTDCVEII